MTAAPALLALAALILGGFGIRELLRSPPKEGRTKARPVSTSVRAGDFAGLGERIRRAGLQGKVTPKAILLVKLFAASFAMVFASAFSGMLPGRLAPLVLLGSAGAGYMLPDLLLERAARRRHRRMVTALPDVLDLLAVSVQTGRGLAGCLRELSGSGRGPLVDELARAGEDMAWGSGQEVALEGLRQRVGGKEITSFVMTLERSRKLGSPLADQLRRQSASLRQDQRRAIEEEAARAAPKIQLVIALILVPSVLLLIVAALAANADSLINMTY